MRIWDINPGYLNRQSLLGEHRELHGIVSIISNNKKGYAHHPETRRWRGYGWALQQRHRLLAAEMTLRGFHDYSPVVSHSPEEIWPEIFPEIFIDEPGQQFQLLTVKYQNKEQGRIPLPQNSQQLWSHHKYSVLARDQNLYRKLGRAVAGSKNGHDFAALAKTVTLQLRQRPTPGSLRNALHHMWGHISDYSSLSKGEIASWPLPRLAAEIAHCALLKKEPYLMHSTALSELQVWIEPPPQEMPPSP
ncbi:MAG: DUF1722 domain-containing protein [Deltaproteobacteria bacterium]|jgi:hypothetical protein|nr:DUF1722 domain-containing protein [Deltaproteobacteria bacterium]